jgi:hypothetical protein
MPKRSFSPSLRPTLERTAIPTLDPTFGFQYDVDQPTISPTEAPSDEPTIAPSDSLSPGRVWVMLDTATETLQDDTLQSIEVAMAGASRHTQRLGTFPTAFFDADMLRSHDSAVTRESLEISLWAGSVILEINIGGMDGKRLAAQLFEDVHGRLPAVLQTRSRC